MNNIENIGIEILEIFTEKQNYDDKFNNLMLNFITKAYELVEMSQDLYQVEHTIKLNKISLKDYILNSYICNTLKNNNINSYSKDELKEFMDRYENKNIFDIKPYRLALELYEKLEELENLESEKIDYELTRLGNILKEIFEIKVLSKGQYQELYNNILLKVKEKYLDNNLIDDKINNYIVQILNDIFNYYLYGNKEIPLKVFTN